MSVPSGWFVVKLIEDNSIEVMPRSWVINFEQCLWPTNLSLNKICLAIKKNLKPTRRSRDCKICKMKVLSKINKQF